MSEIMDSDKQALYLGKLIANTQGLETILRAFLARAEGAKWLIGAKKIHEMKEGDFVGLNAFTNYDTLGQLIGKYNRNEKVVSSGMQIDKTLVKVRDALAHGRVFSEKPEQQPFLLLKFHKPVKGSQYVEVEFSALMTEVWFKENIQRFRKAIQQVHEADERFYGAIL